ncbi:hypothetical protein TB2_022190 [Malus domestica]
MDSVLKLFCNRLQLSEGEEIKVEFSDTVKERLKLSKFFMVGKVFTTRKLCSHIVMGVIKELWLLKVAVEAMAIGEDMILFSFNLEDDMHTVLNGKLWFFKRSLLMLAEVRGMEVPASVLLDEHEFWVQIHGLSPFLMLVSMEETLRAAIGKVVKVDYDHNGCCVEEFLRVRMGVDVSLPLKRDHKWAQCFSSTGGPVHEFRALFGSWLKAGQPVLGSIRGSRPCRFGLGDKGSHEWWMQAPNFTDDEEVEDMDIDTPGEARDSSDRGNKRYLVR